MHVYILEGNDGSFYTGITNDVETRIQKHNGELVGGAKYTKTRRPWVLVYTEEYGSRGDALKREYQIKAMTHEQKRNLLESAILSS